jgi:S-DNA-T family DNA segregation ATPase FtsK/SpoIIIE
VDAERVDEIDDEAAIATVSRAGAALGLRRKAKLKREARSLVLEDTGNPDATDLPPYSLLSEPAERPDSLSEGELDRLGDVLIRTLRTFKVEGEIAGRTTGPVVTQFEVVPAPGVKVNRIAALDADLALALRAPSIRIVAPIPGKGAVGVEVPNPEAEVVNLRRILESAVFQRSRGQLLLGLGKDLTGRPYVADLARMPHLLIAGATGSGKSVCINTIITSLVYRHTPRTLRLLMVDPKMVELSMYAELPHLRHPVVTDPHDAATVLKWAVLEMERRYTLLSENGVRSIAEFNRRVEEGHELRRAFPSGPEDDPDRWRYDEGSLPFIVVIVDELADLMVTVQAEVEKPLTQLAQKARAIGIHLIVATQRPSVNVITGLIKANFPCRVAFRVASKVDSRTIIDQNGADALLGNGDMLFLPPGTSDPVRIQGAYLSTEDTERMMEWYRTEGGTRPEREDDILEYVRAREATDAEEGGLELPEERDVLFRQAAEICILSNQGSTSLLQRRLRIGYGRAARIIDQLHNAGVLGPPDGSRPREVLLGMESLEHVCGDE